MAHWSEFDMEDRSNEMLEFTGVVKVDTGQAYLIIVDNMEAWIPDSQIDCIDEPRIGKEIVKYLALEDIDE